MTEKNIDDLADKIASIVLEKFCNIKNDLYTIGYFTNCIQESKFRAG